MFNSKSPQSCEAPGPTRAELPEKNNATLNRHHALQHNDATRLNTLKCSLPSPLMIDDGSSRQHPKIGDQGAKVDEKQISKGVVPKGEQPDDDLVTPRKALQFKVAHVLLILLFLWLL